MTDHGLRTTDYGPKSLRLVLIGPPGAGKGTQAERLAKHFNIPRLTTGDLFRQAIRKETPLGRKVKGILDAGHLVPDEITIALMAERMEQKDCESGFILDGFPRTVGQAEGLKQWLEEKKLKLDSVLAVAISQEEAMARNTGRRQCSHCGAAHHLKFHPPRKEGLCDKCGGALMQRPDDREETVRERWRVYQQQTTPLIPFYQKQGLLQKVDGNRPPEKVFKAICSLIKG
ncbi:MAG: adenylate kinase [Deltaproteobacteria bacterium]|nr:adenylate kinase [Deltaproteobacteria bacterium]MBI4224079.1 adenylate kinase [Deltaproteobacteria bacterium]